MLRYPTSPVQTRTLERYRRPSAVVIHVQLLPPSWDPFDASPTRVPADRGARCDEGITSCIYKATGGRSRALLARTRGK